MEVFCTVSTEAEADAAIKRMKAVGLRLRDLGVAVHPDEVESVTHPATAMNRSLKLGIGWGAVLGFLVGIALVVYSNAPSFTRWPGMISIPLSLALGWAIYGGIVGGTGILSRALLPAEVQARFEEEVGSGKILVAVHLNSRKESERAAAELYELGATNLHQTGTAAA